MKDRDEERGIRREEGEVGSEEWGKGGCRGWLGRIRRKCGREKGEDIEYRQGKGGGRGGCRRMIGEESWEDARQASRGGREEVSGRKHKKKQGREGGR